MTRNILITTSVVFLIVAIFTVATTLYWYFSGNRNTEMLAAMLFWEGITVIVIGIFMGSFKRQTVYGQTKTYWQTKTKIDHDMHAALAKQGRLMAWAQIVLFSGCLILAVSFFVTEWL